MFLVFKKIFESRALFFKIMFASLLVNLLALATPIYVIQVLQRYVAYGVVSTLITLFFGIIFIVIFEFFFKNIRHRMTRQYELENIIFTNQILNKLVTIKTQIYEVSKNIKNNIINHHILTVQNTYTASNILTIVDVPFTIIFLVALFLIHYQIGLITLFFLALPFLINKLFSERIHKFSQQSTIESNNVFRLFENVLTRNSTIKYFNILNYINKSWNFIANKIANNRENLALEKNLLGSFSSLTASLLTIFVIAWGAVLAVDGQISIGALIGANILASRALTPINRFILLQDNLSKLNDSYLELNKLNSFQSEKSEGREIRELKGEIRLEDISFKYPDQKNPVFESLNIEIKPGQVATVIGNNGSGKTTLIKGLAGIIEFSRGRFFVDNTEVTQFYENWYRKNLIYSPQEPEFVDASLKDNLIGDNKITQENLIQVLKDVKLIDFVNSDNHGINKILEARDTQLPLGIRKRISLARALINGGALVFLDEPTEGLDSEGMESVIKLIKKFKTQNKSIIIATNNQDIINMSDFLIDLNSKPKPIVVRQKNER